MCPRHGVPAAARRGAALLYSHGALRQTDRADRDTRESYKQKKYLHTDSLRLQSKGDNTSSQWRGSRRPCVA